MPPVAPDVAIDCKVCGGATAPIGRRESAYSGASFALRQCPTCRFAFVEDPPTDYASLYDAAYYRGQGADPLTNYEAEVGDPGTIRRYEWDGILRAVRSCAPVSPDTNWLDLGCGLGGFVRHLQQQGLRYSIGSEDGYAQERARALKVTCLGSDELRDRDGTFDVITSIEVIEHVADPVPFLEQVARLLRPGGLFFFTTGNAQPQRGRLTAWPYVIPEIHVSFFEPATMHTAFARVGLVAEDHGFVDGFDSIIRYKTLKNLKRLPSIGLGLVDRVVPWKYASRAIDRRYGVSAFPVGRKPVQID